MSKHRNLFLFLLFISSYKKVLSTSETYDDDSLFLIRVTHAPLVVDGSNSKVTIQHFDGFTPQLWHFQRGIMPGLCFIMNNSTRTVLDVKGDKIILAKKNNESLNQQWFIHSNRRIVNAGLNRTLDVRGKKFEAGNTLQAWPDNKSTAQDFTVKEKRTCGR